LKPVALLNDNQIREAIETHGILINPSIYYVPEAAKYSSYEVHAAAEVGRVDFLEDGELEEKVKSQTREIMINPGDTVRLFTAEHFYLPADVFATVTALGQLYAAGLTVGSTYVDPGTSYRIYLSVSNVSDRPVSIPAGAPIGRAQFFVLGEPAGSLKRSAWRTDLGYRKAGAADVVSSSIETQIAKLKDENSELTTQLNAIRQDLLNAGSLSIPEFESRFVSIRVADELRQALALQRIFFGLLVGILTAVLMPETAWRWLSGENLPPLAKFAIPAIAGGALFAVLVILSRSAAAAVRKQMSDRS
jgi:deoxycytidine triphosphate deaminase